MEVLSLNGPINVLTWYLVSHSESVVSMETVWPMAVSQMIPIARIIGQISWMKTKPHTHETKHEPACHDLPDIES